jgi:hypothetical protein
MNILSSVGFVRDLEGGFWIEWLDLLTPYTLTARGNRQYSATADYTLQFTVTLELGSQSLLRFVTMVH